MAGVAPRTVHVVVHGVVQGVGFRWFVRERARGRQLSGWVANRDDGAVELAIHGNAPDVEELLELLKVGPRGARIERIEVDELESAKDLTTPFDIRR